jgi:hypothetical protein
MLADLLQRLGSRSRGAEALDQRSSRLLPRQAENNLALFALGQLGLTWIAAHGSCRAEHPGRRERAIAAGLRKRDCGPGTRADRQ